MSDFEKVVIRDCVLYRGDSKEIMLSLSVDDCVIVTDPPYGMAYSSGWKSRPIEGDRDTSVRDWVLALWDGPAIVFGRWDCPRPNRVRARLIWSKGEWPGMGDLSFPWGPSDEEIYIIGDGFSGQRTGTVLSCNRLTGDMHHPNEKPVRLMEHLISRCRPKTILDPFMGSGTTGVACARTGRSFVGIELDHDHFATACRRIEDAYNETALFDGPVEREVQMDLIDG